jgi:DNA helicase-2/ATP-dependent DNA helicase PcrA
MDRTERLDVEHFIGAERSMVIAPAGYGKTHTIVDCLGAYRGDKKVLILTHTHAGIASIREKLAEGKISSALYHIETICSFALSYTQTFVHQAQLPEEKDTKELFEFAIDKAIRLFRANPIKEVLSAMYDHLIVDEYQDCSVKQHQMVLLLATVLKTHLLGDPLQGIFDFKGESVNFNDSSFDDFKQNLQHLTTPWRWKNANRLDLGNELAQIRVLIENNQIIKWTQYNAIEFIKANENDIFQKTKSRSYVEKAISSRECKSLVIIHPDSAIKKSRIKIVKSFNGMRLIEAIDENDFYVTCETLDSTDGQKLVCKIVSLMSECCTSTQIWKWFRKDGTLVTKRNGKNEKLSTAVEALIREKTSSNILSLINTIIDVTRCRVIRSDYIHVIRTVLQRSERQQITFLQALSDNRNIARRMGRKVEGKYVGTTLLTKGLEFDTVIVLHAQKFNPKDLYVALTRCTKRLIVISNTDIYPPQKKVVKKTASHKPIQLSLFDSNEF